MNGAIVVLFNPKYRDLKNILNYAYKVNTTFIIDNSAKSHFKELSSFLKIDNKTIIYKFNGKNIGLSKAMNFGIKYLYNLGCKWVLTMDYDSSFKTDIINIYKEYIANHDTSNIALLTPLFNYDRHLVKVYKGTKNVKWKMLSGNFINTNIFIKLGGFKEFLFVDGLDMEYCLHSRKQGYQVVECGQAVLEHKPASTRKLKIFNKTIFRYGYASPLRYYYQAESLIWIFFKYWDLEMLFIYLYKLFKVIFFFDEKRDFLSNYTKGTIAGIQMLKRGE
ncbi:glycosyltransferase [Liquorilactobacillus vini]|uniref:glycosyltransferase n=1 Tax=Liquorilactobacillus vini TaxID=238015 RepID=UPI000319582B|nr:glycosyltransferase [Liquorilactobacillus vini]